MNKLENTFSTTESCGELAIDTYISDEKTLELLKLVYQEKKSIKQSSKYLGINYNTAKRLIKNFRKNKIDLGHKSMNSYLNIVEEISNKSLNNKSALQQDQANTNKNQKLFDVMMTQIKQYDIQLRMLNYEIKNNQMMMFYLTNCANHMIEAMKPSQQ